MDKQEASNGRRQIPLLKRLQRNRKRQQRSAKAIKEKAL
jgi:hypothetical protein